MHGRRQRIALAATATVVALAGCGTSPHTHASINVVAAENFWGDLLRQVAGPDATVQSLLSEPTADPHLFEPGARSGALVANADLVVENGAGYDTWMDRLLAATPSSHRTSLSVATVLKVSGADRNPHLWYDAVHLPTVVTAFGEALAAADPKHATGYRTRATLTITTMQPLLAAVNLLAQRHRGAPVAYTEWVSGLLLNDAGLRVLTPAAFARASEDGTDPSAADVSTMRALVTGHKIKVLIVNSQATNPAATSLGQLAASSGVPVVTVTETMPLGQTFQSWQLGQVRALAEALDR